MDVKAGPAGAVDEDPCRWQRAYQIEFWPIGNRFGPGHRIRLIILGASAASTPSRLALNTVRLGGPLGARLLLPVLPPSANAHRAKARHSKRASRHGHARRRHPRPAFTG